MSAYYGGTLKIVPFWPDFEMHAGSWLGVAFANPNLGQHEFKKLCASRLRAGHGPTPPEFTHYFKLIPIICP